MKPTWNKLNSKLKKKRRPKTKQRSNQSNENNNSSNENNQSNNEENRTGTADTAVREHDDNIKKTRTGTASNKDLQGVDLNEGNIASASTNTVNEVPDVLMEDSRLKQPPVPMDVNAAGVKPPPKPTAPPVPVDANSEVDDDVMDVLDVVDTIDTVCDARATLDVHDSSVPHATTGTAGRKGPPEKLPWNNIPPVLPPKSSAAVKPSGGDDVDDLNDAMAGVAAIDELYARKAENNAAGDAGTGVEDDDRKMPHNQDPAVRVPQQPPQPAAAVPQPPSEPPAAANLVDKDPIGVILLSLMRYTKVEPGEIVTNATDDDFIYHGTNANIIKGRAQATFDKGVKELERDLSNYQRYDRSFLRAVSALNLIKQVRNDGGTRFLERVGGGCYIEIGDRVMLRRVLRRLRKSGNLVDGNDGSGVDEDDVQEEEDVWNLLQLKMTNKPATPMHQPSQGGTPIRSGENSFGEDDPYVDEDALSSQQQGIEIRSSRNEQDNGDMVDDKQQELISEEDRHVKEMHEKFETLEIINDDADYFHTGDGSQYDGNAKRKGNKLMTEEKEYTKIVRRLNKHLSSNSKFTAENTLKAMTNVAERKKSGQRYDSLVEPIKELDNKKQEALEQRARDNASFATLEQKFNGPVWQQHQFRAMTNEQTFKPTTPGGEEVETNNSELGDSYSHRQTYRVYNDHAGRVIGCTTGNAIPQYPCDICNAGGTTVTWDQSGFRGSGYIPAFIKNNRKWCRTHCSCDPTITRCRDCYLKHVEVKWEEEYPDHPKEVANNHQYLSPEKIKGRKCVKKGCTKLYETYVCSCDTNSRYCADHFLEHFCDQLCRKKTAQELADDETDDENE